MSDKGVRQVLELDASAATVYVERSGMAERTGGRWLVFASEVIHELPDGGYRITDSRPDSFPGTNFVLAPL